MAKLTDDDIANIPTTYDQAIADAQQTRAATLQQAIDEGRTQKDLATLTGYTRETLRRILNPQAAEDIKARRRKPAAESAD